MENVEEKNINKEVRYNINHILMSDISDLAGEIKGNAIIIG